MQEGLPCCVGYIIMYILTLKESQSVFSRAHPLWPKKRILLLFTLWDWNILHYKERFGARGSDRSVFYGVVWVVGGWTMESGTLCTYLCCHKFGCSADCRVWARDQIYKTVWIVKLLHPPALSSAPLAKASSSSSTMLLLITIRGLQWKLNWMEDSADYCTVNAAAAVIAWSLVCWWCPIITTSTTTIIIM